jgi:hypothetical protein
MAFGRSLDAGEPARPGGRRAGRHELHRLERSAVLATGTLACPACDAPVLPALPVTPPDPLSCPFCAHAGAVRDFLTLGGTPRPTRVEVRVVPRRSRGR